MSKTFILRFAVLAACEVAFVACMPSGAADSGTIDSSVPSVRTPAVALSPELVLIMRGNAEAGTERVAAAAAGGSRVRITTKLGWPSRVHLETSLAIDPVTARVVDMQMSGTPYPWQRSATGSPPAASPFPVSLQALLVAEWKRNGRPTRSAGIARGDVGIEPCGVERLPGIADGQGLAFECYTVSGLPWGRTTLWVTAQGRLVAAVIPNALAPVVAVTPGSTAAYDSLLAAAARHGVERATPAAVSAPASDLAIVGVRVVPGDDGAVIDHGTVVVRNGRIAAVGPSGATPVPAQARVVDGAGLTVLPGLWDMHGHLKQVEWLPAYLAVGVTTVRDLGNESSFLLEMRSSLRRGERIGPRILAAGLIDATPAAGQPYTGPARRADTPEAGRRLVRRYHALGYDQIKTWANIRPDVLQAVTAEAHRLGLRVTGHVPNGIEAVEGVRLGMDEIAHSGDLVEAMGPEGPDGEPGRRIVDALAGAGTVVDPTLVVIRYGTRSRTSPLATFEPCARDVPGELLALWDGLASAPEDSAAGEAALSRALRAVGALHRAGVPIVAGSDQGIPGCSLLYELELYVRAGLTPLEAIRTATSIPAGVMGLLPDHGTIAVGKRADLLVVAGDPTRDIRALRATRHVVVDGRLLSPATLRPLAYPGLPLQERP